MNTALINKTTMYGIFRQTLHYYYYIIKRRIWLYMYALYTWLYYIILLYKLHFYSYLSL